MAEFCNPDSFEVVMAKSEKDYTVKKLGELLPCAFKL
jgi:cytidine deaminase